MRTLVVAALVAASWKAERAVAVEAGF